MIHEKIKIQMPGSCDYAALYTYVLDYYDKLGVEKRPIVIVCPGGGYDHTSDREGEALALMFNSIGIHAAVLRYSTGPSTFPTDLSELAFAVKFLREKAQEWHIDKDKILIQGSSAGGHLIASLGCFWNKAFLPSEVKKGFGKILGGNGRGMMNMDGSDDYAAVFNPDEIRYSKVSNEDIRPNGLILNYPVITSGEYAHAGSIKNLIGDLENADDFSDEKGISMSDFVSLEKRVSKDVPACFIWHTFEDQAVPVENSILFAAALRKAGVSTELHIFPHGCHGLGLGTALTAANEGKEVVPEVNMWTSLVKNWIEINYPITTKF
ncbi:MAG: alpha/beta hydrolase [Lachnospiraceae bacterium]|nr:alpha/beta hydrolase [Lachnospiraceae bacterium]